MVERLRAAWATASSTPWRRAPLLLWRRPGVLAAVAGACAVMVAAVAAVPLFISSTGTASVALQADERCPRDTGVSLLLRASARAIREPGPDIFRPLDDRLAPTNRWATLPLVVLGGTDPGRTVQTSLLTRDDAFEHVEVLDGPSGPGVWISDRAAEATGLGVGDAAAVGATTVPVAAVYRDLAGNSVDRFWCSNGDLLLIDARGGELVLPPPLVLADRATFADVMADLTNQPAVSVAEAGLANALTVAEADDLVHELACHGDRVGELAWCEDGQPGPPGAAPLADDGDFVQRFFRSSLPFLTRRSRAIQTAVGSGIWPVSAFAALAGAGLVAAAASLWFDRRRREVVLLSVRGVSPLGLGSKAVLELAPALLGGAVAGVVIAAGLVAGLGPSSALEPVAVRRAAAGAGVALVGAALTVAAVVTARVRAAAGGRRVRRFPLAAVPWELGLIALTVVSYRRLGEWGVPVGRGADVTRVDVLGLLFPVLFLLTVVAVVSRLLGLGLRPLRSASRSWPPALYLAVRRVARSRTAVLGLVAASAVAVGVLVYAATMDRSLHATLDAKAMTFVGSDAAVGIEADTVLPPAVADRATLVEILRGSVDVAGDRRSVRVITIDPATFADVAFWDDTFSDSSLDDIVDRLAATGGDTVPAVVVGLDVDGPTEAVVGEGRPAELTIEPVADVDAFPGMKRGKPTVFIAADALKDAEFSEHRTEAWIRGDRDDNLAQLVRAGIPFEEVREAGEVADRSAFVTVSWTFGFLRSLGLAAGVLALGGVAVHLDARRRDRVLGYAFMRRMGLSGRQHRRALLTELVASVLVGCWVGFGAAVVGAWLAHGHIDPVPILRPDPLLRPAVGAIVATAIGSVVVVVAAAVIAQRRAERDDPVEVLRAGA